ncbi:MAG: D-alanyl-D-alanine carboxypeptidase, partial [Clostridia bacterium]|nr:D-alanyl-D-alanine carboxypeptidase [Clostridia bacterium]
MKIILIVTVSLFVLSLVCLGVSLAVDIIDNNSSYGVVGSGGDGGGKKQPSTPVDSTVSGVGKKTSIVLPCATKEGVYLGVSNERTQDISADTAIKSGAAVLVDITDNVTVAGKNADARIYPASMTKVMTLLVACENAKDPNALLTVTKAMAEEYKKPTNQGASLAKAMAEGEQITVEDALYMVIYESDTMACWLLADYVAGGEAQFVQMMNQRATELGLTGTHFTNCTGLYNTEHYTTCRDMAAIMAAAMNN